MAYIGLQKYQDGIYERKKRRIYYRHNIGVYLRYNGKDRERTDKLRSLRLLSQSRYSIDGPRYIFYKCET